MRLISVLSGAAGALAEMIGYISSAEASQQQSCITRADTEIHPIRSCPLIVSGFYFNPAEGARASFKRRRVGESASVLGCAIGLEITQRPTFPLQVRVAPLMRFSSVSLAALRSIGFHYRCLN